MSRFFPGKFKKITYLGPLAALMASSLACSTSLNNAAPTTVAQASSVIFIAPENKSTVAEGSNIVFAAQATSNTGVGKISFKVDDAPMGTQDAPAAGMLSFTAVQPWVAAGQQGHLITADAYGPDGTAFGEATITLVVVAPAGQSAAGPSAATVAATTPASGPAAPTSGPTIIVITNTPQSAAASPAASPAGNTGQPVLVVKNPNLNIRAGDGTNFPLIGAMKTGDTANIIGRNAARTWWFIQKDQMQGWVIATTQYSTVQGDTANVPLVKSPPTPAASAAPAGAAQAPTSTVGPYADLVIDSVTLNPQTPTANQTFTVVVVIRNQGTVDAPGSLLAGVFQPGNENSNTAVPAIKAGQSVTINLPVTLHSGGANQTGTITLDANNNVDQGPNGKANDSRTVTYNIN